MHRLTLAAVLIALLAVTVAQAEEAKGPLILPPDVEVSVLTGTTFPEGVLGGALSYRIAKFADREQYVWLDLGLQVDTMDVGRTSPIFGASTNLPTGAVKTRAGAGVRAPSWNFGGMDFILYTRITY